MGLKRTKSEYRDAIRERMNSPLRTFFGYDEMDDLLRYKEAKEPFLYVDHAYFNRGYENKNFRVIYNSVHQTNILDLPNDRNKQFHVRLHDWHQGEKIVYIPATPNPLLFHNEKDWNDKAIDQLVSLTSRDIIVKADKTKKLATMLDDCWALVTHSSVAGVEAACMGVPVICSDKCPAWGVGTELSNIEYPVMPDRNQWVNTLAYSQFTFNEMQDGSAWEIIKEINQL